MNNVKKLIENLRENFDEVLSEKIVKAGSKWEVRSEKGKLLGTFDTEEEAKERLRQIEYFKHKNESYTEHKGYKVQITSYDVVVRDSKGTIVGRFATEDEAIEFIDDLEGDYDE